jgi:Fur family peroxide stress response transcriptional regulator
MTLSSHHGSVRPTSPSLQTRRVQEIVGALKAAGCRVTPQRLAIVQAFADSRSHPGVEAVYDAVRKAFPTTSLATVYKTVTLLKELGEAVEIGFGDDRNRYDVRNPTPHPHLVCLRCRSIRDSDLAPLDHLSDRLAAATGYRILGQRVDFYGICPECQASAPEGAGAAAPDGPAAPWRET